jgi:hypothetical protein
MRRTLALALLLVAPLLQAQAPPVRTLPKTPTIRTGESPDAPSSLSAKLRSDLLTANAAAQAALSRLRSQAVAKPPTQEQKLALAAHQAGVDKPCDRTLFNVEGAAANFTIQPGQLVLLNGCFRGSSNAEVRIEGGSLPGGVLLLEVQERGDGYFYGKVPDVTGVPDQPVSVVVRFFSDGFRTAPRNGSFYAKRQTWDTYVDDQVCPNFRVNERPPIVNISGDGPLCTSASHPVAGGVDRWSSRAREQGYRITKFWWKAYTDAVPTAVRGTDDGSIEVVHPGDSWYGAYRVKVEGPAGLRPF